MADRDDGTLTDPFSFVGTQTLAAATGPAPKTLDETPIRPPPSAPSTGAEAAALRARAAALRDELNKKVGPDRVDQVKSYQDAVRAEQLAVKGAELADKTTADSQRKAKGHNETASDREAAAVKAATRCPSSTDCRTTR